VLCRRSIDGWPSAEGKDPQADQIEQKNERNQRPSAAVTGSMQNTCNGHTQKNRRMNAKSGMIIGISQKYSGGTAQQGQNC
jgi:hypothetical protein